MLLLLRVNYREGNDQGKQKESNLIRSRLTLDKQGINTTLKQEILAPGNCLHYQNMNYKLIQKGSVRSSIDLNGNSGKGYLLSIKY